MKIFCTGENVPGPQAGKGGAFSSEPSFFIKPETALIKAGQAFFIPDFSISVSCGVSLVARICKPGKQIQSRFAPSYYQEIGAGLTFTAHDLLLRHISQGLPWEMGVAFDGSAAVSRLVPAGSLDETKGVCFSLKKNSRHEYEASSKRMMQDFDELIALVSGYVTLKIGDYLFTGTPGYVPVEAGDILEVSLQEEKVLKVAVR